MKQTSMILMSDYYKQAHAEQYPEGITKLISYATARMTRIPKEMMGDKLTVFGIQSYVKDFLIDRFNDTFFNVPLEKAMEEYKMVIGETFPLQYVNTGKFEALHKLGYLPVEIGCLEEGTRVPIRNAFELPEGQCQVPFMYIINTHPDFPWITEFLESVTSSEVWYTMAIANQAFYYRQIVNKWYDKTGCDNAAKKSAISEFGFRGGEGSEAAVKASAAFLTSFNKSATIPAIKYIHDYYGDPVGEIGGGMISTEHSVMCSNYAVDLQELKENAVVVKDNEVVMSPKEGVVYYSEKADKLFVVAPLDKKPSIDSKYVIERWYNIINENNREVWASYIINVEGTFLKKLFSTLYPAGAVSVVMDTYDYWANLQRCGEGELREIITHRDGTVFFRGDSGDPVDIICGEKPEKFKDFTEVNEQIAKGRFPSLVEVDKGIFRRVDNEPGDFTWKEVDKTSVEMLGTVELLWNMFGGTVNEAGYKVLDKHVRAIYGDSITPNRANQIYQRLAEKGFAACNVALGAGSFSTQCTETADGKLLPFTRDSYGIAIKCCYVEDKDGNTYEVFKNPKTDTGKFKKSQHGMIWVGLNKDGEIIAKDGYTSYNIPDDNMLVPIFRNGKMLKETTLNEVRQRLHNNNF